MFKLLIFISSQQSAVSSQWREEIKRTLRTSGTLGTFYAFYVPGVLRVLRVPKTTKPYALRAMLQPWCFGGWLLAFSFWLLAFSF